MTDEGKKSDLAREDAGAADFSGAENSENSENSESFSGAEEFSENPDEDFADEENDDDFADDEKSANSEREKPEKSADENPEKSDGNDDFRANLKPFTAQNRAAARKLLSGRWRNSDYVHLHNHTNYSVLDGLTKIPEMLEVTQDFGQDAIAMTDHGTLSGWLDFQKQAEKAGVKSILGLEAYVAARGHKDRDPQKDRARYHLTLLAKNDQGRKNLMRLSSIANLEGVYYKPRIDHALIEKYHDGIICLSGCASGEIGESLRVGDYDKALGIAKWYRSIFGEDYFMEVQDHGHPDAPKHWEVQRKINEGALKIGAELGIPAVVTCDAHYARITDTDAHEILLCVGTGSFLSDKNRMSLADFHLHIVDPAEIIARWGEDYPDVVINSRIIADRCNTKIPTGQILIPKYPIDAETVASLREQWRSRDEKAPDDAKTEFNQDRELLWRMVWRGAAWRYGTAPEKNTLAIEDARKLLPQKVVDRIDYELSIVDRMGYNGYFLIVSDFINWGKAQGILFGPGRGSAAGAVLSYAIRITEVDPLEFDLMFERFLNPDRITMPDIDVDIQDTRRGEVIQYCVEKYGFDHVSNIVTFGTMASKAAVKDVARVLEVPFAEANRLSSLVPDPTQGHHVPLKIAIKDYPDLKKEYESNPTSKRVLDYAIQLEGTIRSHGVHASATVIAPDELVKYIPLEMAQKGVVAVQFPGPQVEEVGLLKMDFLGLTNLSIIDDCLKMVKAIHGVDIDLEQIPMDDPAVYKLFQTGGALGVFQFESAGMQRYMVELKPTKFTDLIAMNALYRPGPMSTIPQFIRRAHGEEAVTYDDPHMEKSLKDTYGVLVYQEQFMKIVRDMAGFTGGESDTLRKAIAKKKIGLMREFKSKFIDGSVEHVGADREKMEKFWNHLEDFASYCFNKSHAACYSLVAYWTAYLKAHWPAEYMAALMSSDAGNTDRLTIEISECNRLGIKVQNPDVNESFRKFAVVPETGNIRFGLSAIKGVGTTAIDSIRAAVHEKPFESLEDFARRTDSRVVNKRVYESLIKSGAFDRFARSVEPENDDDDGIRDDRSDLLFSLDEIVAFASKVQKEAASGQESLFGMLGAAEVSAGAETHLTIHRSPTKLAQSDILAAERELMGLYLSAHPLDKFATYFRENFTPFASIKSSHDGALVDVGGLLSRLKPFTTKSGTKMAFCSIEDKTREMEFVIFPKLFATLPDDLAPGAILHLRGRVQGKDRDGVTLPDPTLVADVIEILGDDTVANYRPTGIEHGAIDMKTVSRRRTFSRDSAARSKQVASVNTARATPTSAPKSIPPANFTPVDDTPRKLFVHVANPSDGAKLTKLRDLVRENAGDDDVILVLGDAKKSAIKMPIRAKIGDDLLGEIAKIYGEKSTFVK